jgi:DNA polymerase-3 subunit gamma/tau
MTYQVLARKWRPRDFSQMVGQGHVLRALVNALDTQRLHHAYLFTGTRGVGKTSIARVLAKALNCEQGVSSTPCGQCGSCREVEEGRFVDLIEVDAASRTKVDDTRDLLENVQYAPARGRFKVYLIDEVHMFSNSSFNALLKTLEEPPPHVKFLLATTDPKKLPITILSRCLQFNLKRLSAEQIREQLQKILDAEGMSAERGALDLIANAADGSMRDSLSLLDQAIAFTNGTLAAHEVASMLGTVGTGQVLPLVEALASGDGAALLSCARALAEFTPDFAQILGEMLSVLRRVAVCQALGEQAETLEEDTAVKALARTLNPEECQLFYQLGLHGRRDLPLAPEPLIGFEMALLRMLAFKPETGLSPESSAPVGAQAVPVAAAPRAESRQAPVVPPTPLAQADISARPPERQAAPAAPAKPVKPQSSPVAERAPPSPAGEGSTADLPLDWAATVAGLQASGLVREFARHCAFLRMEGNVIELSLTPQSENLRSERQVKALEQALCQALGRDVTLRFKRDGGASAQTPAQALSEAEAARQAAAARQIETDPNVLALQRQFGATIERVDPTDP